MIGDVFSVNNMVLQISNIMYIEKDTCKFHLNEFVEWIYHADQGAPFTETWINFNPCMDK